MLTRRRLGPVRLVLVRHGESVGNLADAAARSAGAARLDLDQRDADVPLSDTGRDQAQALGRHLTDLDPDELPTAVVSSPYRRSRETAELALATVLPDLPVLVDERLRERELGVFDGFTGTGIRETFHDEAVRREYLGKFYYRPPSGESWVDVALRVRSVLHDIGTTPSADRLWIFTHQAVITCFRYVLDGMDEAQILELDRTVPVPNCSTTSYRRGPDGQPELEEYASAQAVEEAGAATTHEPEQAGKGEVSS